MSGATLAFGGCRFRFRSDDSGVQFRVVEPHTFFLVDEAARPDCEIECTFGDAAPSQGEPDFESGGIWRSRDLPDGAQEVSFFTAEALGTRVPLMRITLGKDLRTVKLVHAPLWGAERTLPIGYPIDEYLAARLLGRSGKVILHACAVRDGNGALIFMGHSGAGKSTIAELAESVGGEVLSDDRTIMAVEDGVVKAWGTPWHGSYTRGSPLSAEVKGVFLLSQASEDEVVPIPEARSFMEMFVRLVQPTTNKEELLASVSTLERIVALVGLAELRFRPTPAAYQRARWFANLG